jgi:hypothetical protein
MMAQSRPSEARLLRQIVQEMTSILPSGWDLEATPPAGKGRPDFIGRITAPDGTSSEVIVEVKRTVVPRNIDAVMSQLRSYTAQGSATDAMLIVAAPYLSETTREQIEGQGASYIDSTGNVLLRSGRPGLFIKLRGASKDPWPSDETLRSLKGRGSARAVRALLDFVPPYGVRDLAEKADVPLGSLSRTIDLLDREGLIERADRGPITDVDWQRVIRRWAKDYETATSNQVVTYLDPRGLAALAEKLGKLKRGYATTGSLAAQRFSPIAPTRLASVYVNDVIRWGERLGLRAADAGANVWLIEPYDRVVFERTIIRDGLVCVNPSQLAVDLLTGPGRDPAEGEELLAWMERNQDAWRLR